jgi:DNA-binding MarR family transcriptional regulator
MPTSTPQPHAREPLEGWNMPELEGVDDLSAQAFRAFIVTARLHFKGMLASMAGSRAQHGQAMCLRMLSVNDGATQRDVARMLHVAPPTVSKMLGTLEKAGLVERRPDPADQRLTRVHITDAGRRRELEMGVAVGAYVNATFAMLTEQERGELVRLLDKLRDSIAGTPTQHEAAR